MGVTNELLMVERSPCFRVRFLDVIEDDVAGGVEGVLVGGWVAD